MHILEPLSLYQFHRVAIQEPKVLLAGRNGVCADTVGTAVMGFDPQAGHMAHPFPGENHLRFLASKGLGTNDPSRIEIVGLPIEKALYPFDKKTAIEAVA